MKTYVGIDIGGTKMYLCHVREGEICKEVQVPTGMEASLEYFQKNIQDFVAGLSEKPEALGIALPGLVQDNRLVVSDVLPRLDGSRAEDFSSELPCTLVNDVRAATIFETAHRLDSAIVVMIGTGIACGVYTGGAIVTGEQGFAGELGFTKIPGEDGAIQTLDELASGAAILKKAGMPPAQLLEKLHKGDAACQKIIQQASFYMGLALSNLISVLNPAEVILGGSTPTYPGYFENVQATAERYTMEEIMAHCHLRMTRHPKNLVALGAVENAKSHL